MLRAQSGDREALNDLLKIIEQPLYRYIFRLVGERALTEDILQEVFIKIYRKLKWLQEPEFFRPWAYRIASRDAFKHLKRERQWSGQIRDEAVIEAIPAAIPEQGLSMELRDRLPELLAHVSSASRAVIILHYLHDMSLVEVADVLGINIGTVKSRLAYGLSNLRRAFKERGHSQEGSK